MGCHDPLKAPPAPRDIAIYLAAERPRYVAFVRSRVHDPALAEDIVQDALARAIDGSSGLRGEVDPWFFRALRNAIVDHARRRGASSRALEALQGELDGAASIAADPTPTPCPCVLRVQKQMKPEYADALEQVEIEGEAVKTFAAARGISATNAGVRVFRAREALRRGVVATCGACAANGCTDCTCVGAPG